MNLPTVCKSHTQDSDGLVLPSAAAVWDIQWIPHPCRDLEHTQYSDRAASFALDSDDRSTSRHYAVTLRGAYTERAYMPVNVRSSLITGMYARSSHIASAK